MNEAKLKEIYSTLKLMNENNVLEFLIKIEILNLDEIKDKTIILKYIDMSVNHCKICQKLNLNEDYIKQLKKVKINLIKYLNLRGDKEQGL